MTLRPDTCVTCGDVAVVGVVVDAGEVTATIEVDGAREAVGVELVAPVSVGDRVLCHAGVALTKVEDAT